MIHLVVTATLVCLASWAGLAVGAGNVGLQRAVSIGPWTLLEQPLAVILPTALAFATAAALTGASRVTAGPPWRLIAAVLIGDLFGAVVLAPVLIGELEVEHAPVVFVVIAVLGLQPLATALGASFASRRASP